MVRDSGNNILEKTILRETNIIGKKSRLYMSIQ